MALILPKHSLDGARAKLSRAQHHFEQLDSAIKAWEGTIKDSDRSSFKFDPDRKTLTILANNTRPPDPTWALVIGDIVHNLRSALDHIVCRLALLIGNPIECCEETSFPICDTPAAFKNAKRIIKPLISSEALTLIQKCQPYYASEAQGQPAQTHVLWVLSQLDIIDKHRLLIVVNKQIRPLELTYSIGDARPITRPIDSGWQPLKDGAHLVTVDFGSVPSEFEGEVHVNFQMAVKIQLTDTGLVCDEVNVTDALRPCIEIVAQIVDEFDGRFFKVIGPTHSRRFRHRARLMAIRTGKR